MDSRQEVGQERIKVYPFRLGIFVIFGGLFEFEIKEKGER
jgi:hypothetical protein